MSQAKPCRETYINLYHPLHRHPCRSEHGGDIPAALFCLLGHGTFDQVSELVCGDLARDEDLIVCYDGLGLCMCVGESALVSILSGFTGVSGWSEWG